ncbi:RIOX2 [Scenedesmus sp. PABB004]|nr:RIOX2 [Scenedesmus sp. PABB004]
MGKKRDKAAAKEAAARDAQVPWPAVDADPIGFLVAPESPETFLSKYWEQQPAVFRATPERAALFQGLCSLPALLAWLRAREAKAGPLEFGVDVNAARYRDGVRETPNGDVADAATLQRLHNERGCTLQLHQPQRFFDPCWRLLAALERALGCLVGANAYLTPGGSQGLAPHHDDVELWVVQTAGTKKWRVYDPTNGYALPNQPGADLDQAALGKPVLEVELRVGDTLYMPRGAVHQAAASEGTDSAHITISTFQRCSFADLATHLLQVGLASQDEPECLPLAARRSPAPGTLLQHSLHKVLAPGQSGSTTPDALAGLAVALRAIADKLEASPDMLTPAVHASAMDFLMNRLPPHPRQLPGRGPAPRLDDAVWCRAAGWAYMLPFELTGMNCEDDMFDGLEEGSVKVVTCLANSREEHMIIQDPDASSDEEADDDDDGSGSGSGSGGGSDDGDDDGSGDASGSGGGSDDGGAAENGAGGGGEAAPKKHKCGDAHAHAHAHDGDGHACCGDDGGRGHGVQEHSLSSGAADRENMVAALPGLVLAPGLVRAAAAFMTRESAATAIPVRELPLAGDASKLQLAYALWAEGLAACVPAGAATGKGAGAKEGGGKKKRAPRPGGDETATSSGKARPGKKAKA